MDNDKNFTITDLLRYSYEEKPVDFAHAFNELIGDKLIDAIHNKKIEVAQRIYSGSPENYETDYETEVE